jgi:hypothetical protein
LAGDIPGCVSARRGSLGALDVQIHPTNPRQPDRPLFRASFNQYQQPSHASSCRFALTTNDLRFGLLINGILRLGQPLSHLHWQTAPMNMKIVAVSPHSGCLSPIQTVIPSIARKIQPAID